MRLILRILLVGILGASICFFIIILFNNYLFPISVNQFLVGWFSCIGYFTIAEFLFKNPSDQ